MFERFTEQSRRAVVLAQEEARQLDHNYIGTGHVLLGLISQDDCVTRATPEIPRRPPASENVVPPSYRVGYEPITQTSRHPPGRAVRVRGL
jgi:Clp amino terminal domain, pathogenicity island component